MAGGAGVLEIEQGLNGSGATLDDVVVDNTYGTIQIDPHGGPGPGTPVTLVLADGTTVTGGQINVGTAGGDGGVLEIEQGLNGLGATLDGVGVDNSFGTVQVDSDATLALDNVATVTGGDFNIAAAAHLTVAGDTTISSAVDDDGTIQVQQSAALHLTHSIAGSGSIELAAGSDVDHLTLLELNATNTPGNTPTVHFDGGFTDLKIDTSTFNGSISGLTSTDEIDLATIGYGLTGLTTTWATYTSNANNTGGVLEITDGVHSPIDLTLIGDYRFAHFAGSDDGSGHTLITMNAGDDLPLISNVTDGTTGEVGGQTGVATPQDIATGTVTFTDVDLSERPTVSASFQSAAYTDADGHSVDISSLTSEQQAAIAATELSSLSIAADANNHNSGSSTWTYSIADNTLDFLAAGEQLHADLHGDGQRQ